MSTILPVPPNLKPCQTYLKLASDHEKINSTLTYWCRLYALQMGMKIDAKSKENIQFLGSIMAWLETEKKSRETDEKITNEVVAQAHIENYGMKIFLKADEDDRAGNATKNTAKQFFTAAQIFDMSAVFGEVSDELLQKSKYSKWRAAYIIKCIKNNEKPLPPEDEEKTNEDDQLNDQPSDQLSNLPPNEPYNYNNQPGFNTDHTSAYSDYNVNKMTDLSIDNNKPSSATSTATNDYFKNQISTTSTDSTTTDYSATAMNGIKLSKDQIFKSQKYCKWASSALDYDDIKTAVSNLQKALNILNRGTEE